MFLQKKIMESIASFKGLITVYLCLRAFLFGNWKDGSLIKPFSFDAIYLPGNSQVSCLPQPRPEALDQSSGIVDCGQVAMQQYTKGDEKIPPYSGWISACAQMHD